MNLNFVKISIITVVFNRIDYVMDAVLSLKKQNYHNIEHIVIDGSSTDGTFELLRKHLDKSTLLISEPDDGIYFAINKGLKFATGDIIGLLHSDDFFADENVLSDVADAFSDSTINAVYGDLQYIAQDNLEKVIRTWIAGNFRPSDLKYGWMPPHPTLFLRKKLLKFYGDYDTSFDIAADYEFILRYFCQYEFRCAYISRVLVKMRMGGVSNQSLSKIVKKSSEDYRAIKRHGIGGVFTLIMKNLRKLNQFSWRIESVRNQA